MKHELPMPKLPKSGMPRELKSQVLLLGQLATLLIGTSFLPSLMLRKDSLEVIESHVESTGAHGKGSGGAHGGAHGGAEGHHDTLVLDMQSTLVIVAMLIFVTILFEKARHHLEDTVPPLMKDVLTALFAELTVLGFIALYAFFMLQTGLLTVVSQKVYGESEHLLHLFETVHFSLFFVMVIFLFQAFILLRTLISVEDVWLETEAVIRQYNRGPQPAIAQLLVTYKAARHSCWRRCCLRPLWSYRVHEAKQDLRYALLRERFVAPVKLAKGDLVLETDFEFCSYLRRRGVALVSKVLHVEPRTWIALLLFLGVVFETPVVMDHYGLPQPSAEAVALLGWAVWLVCALVQAKVNWINDQLLSRHVLLRGPPKEDDEEAPTALLVEPPSNPPYESRAMRPSESRHEQLFWGGGRGPGRLVFVVRTLLLVSAVMLAIIFEWMTNNPADMPILLVALYPVLDVILGSPRRLLPSIVMATSVEQMKYAPDIKVRARARGGQLSAARSTSAPPVSAATRLCSPSLHPITHPPSPPFLVPHACWVSHACVCVAVDAA